MAQKLSAIASSMLTNAAATATAIAGGTTTAEVQDLARLLTVLSTRNDLVQPGIQQAYPNQLKNILPG